MPFNFLKYKSRHYNVTSKSLFVISVHHLLDTSTTVDCTLSSESTGQECLDNVCQRLLINQPEFFGLRYLIKGSRDELRWIDLERPLSRQLEKYAACPKLYLRVQYYIISGVSLLDDEVSRYYYFLQLKNDVVEGRISCDVKQAVLLALYCRQAEYDNYQQKDKNTIDYLKTLLPFPKRVLEEGLQESLIEEILQHNPGLQNLNQSAAEECFIAVCQQVDGYGQEKFWVKDNHSNEVQLGLSINGIAVWCQDKIKFYPWHEVKNVINLKRTFNIEQEEKQIVSFTFPEAETGRYFWRLCVLQHLFYMKYELNRTQQQQQQQQQQQNQQQLQQSITNLSVSSVGQRPSPGNQSSSTANLFQNYSSDYNNDDSQEDLLNEHLYFTESQILEKKNSVISSNLSLTNSQQQLHQLQQQQQYQILGQSRTNIPNIVNDYGGSTTTTNNGGGSGISGSGVFSSQIIDQLDNHNIYHQSNNRLQSTSCLDLSNNNYNNNNNINGQDIERLKALLPTYRPAPDYETAVQQKYRASSSNEIQMIRRVPSQAAIYVSGGGSQPDVHNLSKDNNNIAMQHHFVQQQHHQQQQLHHYPDVTQTTAAAAVLQNQINHGSAANLYSNIDLVQRLQLMRLKPPPPYPANRLSSTSTPDLAVAAAATNIQRTPFGYRGGTYVSGSSPDLVSTRTFLNAPQHSQQQQLQHQQQQQQQYPPVQYSYLNHPIVGHHHSQPYLPHGTFENLNMIEEQPPPLPESLAPSAAATTIFSKPQPPIPPQSLYRQQQQQQHLQQQQQQNESNLLHKSTINGSIEPIYENVPFPCLPPPQQQQSSGSTIEIRNRTSSIQSAPGGIHQETSNLQDISMTGVSGGSATNMLTNSNNHHISNEFLPHQTQQSTKLTGNITGSSSNFSLNKNIVDQMSGNVNDFQHHHQQQLQQQQQQHSNILKINSGSANISDRNISVHSSSIGSSTKYQEEKISGSASTNPNTSTAISSFLNSSHGSGFSSTSAINDSAISSSSSSVAVIGKEKRKKRWGILGGVGKSKNTSNEKKSATLGREKTNKSKNKDEQLSKEEANIRHRWSTGLPKLQPLSASYSKDKLCQILDSKLNDTQLFLEFERIPKRRDSARYECALLVENKTKNSDPNFLPYDDNRVRITPTMDNRHGYVNASHISSTVGTNQRFYIIAQSPYDQHTIQIFWQCVWEADVYLLVQLSEDLNYIPPTTNKSIECGQFQIFQEFSQKTDRCITSKLRLYHQQSKRFRSVWHLNYTDWAEQNCPRDVGLFLDFLEELSSVRSASINEVPPGHNTNPPVLIHCREGAGRSGVTLAADLLLYTLDHNQDLDIPRVIGQLRHQRDNLIPSLAQYKFIYALLITYLKRTRLI